MVEETATKRLRIWYVLLYSAFFAIHCIYILTWTFALLIPS